jgi:hypothetical protein
MHTRNTFRYRLEIALLSASLVLTATPSTAFAQSGSAGGSIGNDEKSLSGSREAPRSVDPSKPARRSKPEAEEPRRASRNSGGGGGGNNFDGAWIVNAVGVTCSGSSSNAVVVTSGRIIGETARGTVSPNGTVHGTASGNGLTITTIGRLSGRSGGGTFRQSDGCTGTWTASKQ